MANDFVLYLYAAALVLPYVAIAIGLALLAIPSRPQAIDHLTSRRAA